MKKFCYLTAGGRTGLLPQVHTGFFKVVKMTSSRM